MNLYNKKLIKHDLLNIKRWVENIEWKEVKKQLHTILKNSRNSKYASSTSNINYEVYYSAKRLSQILDSNEIIQLLRDFNNNFYFKNYKQDKNYDQIMNVNITMLGGFNMNKFANKFKSNATTYAKKAQSHVVEQSKQMAEQAKQYAQEQSKQMIQQAKHYAQQQGQQMAKQAQQYVQQQGQQIAQQGQQIAQQAQQYVQQQGQQIAQQGQVYLQNQAKLAQQQIQNTLQQVQNKTQQIGNQLNQHAQMYLTPQYQQQSNKTIISHIPQQYYNPSSTQIPLNNIPTIQQIPMTRQIPMTQQIPAVRQIPTVQQIPMTQQIPTVQQIGSVGYIQPPLPVIQVHQLPIEQFAEPQHESSKGLIGSFFESAGDIGKKILGL